MKDFYQHALQFWINATAHVSAGGRKEKSFESQIRQRLFSIFQIGEMYHFVFDIAQVKFDFVSPEIKQVLGLSDTITVREFLERIHPEDQVYFMNFEDHSKVFFKSLPPAQVQQYKVRYDFRIRNAKDQYVRLLHQLLIIQDDGNGVPLKSFAVHTDITHLKENGKPTLSFIGLNGLPSYLNVSVEEVYKMEKGPLSRREQEVLSLLASGQSSEHIADTLHITRHTVASHRKNLLRKTRSANTTELISKSIVEGWI